METPHRMREEVYRLLACATSEPDRQIKQVYAARAFHLAQLAEVTERKINERADYSPMAAPNDSGRNRPRKT